MDQFLMVLLSVMNKSNSTSAKCSLLIINLSRVYQCTTTKLRVCVFSETIVEWKLTILTPIYGKWIGWYNSTQIILECVKISLCCINGIFRSSPSTPCHDAHHCLPSLYTRHNKLLVAFTKEASPTIVFINLHWQLI